MGRPEKSGLDYFPLDTTWETNMKLIKAKFGLLGIGCIIELYRAIYREGYAMKWDEDTQLLFSSEHGIPLETLSEIINYSVGKGVFHAGKLNKLRSLTSRGIQRRWKKIAKESKRAVCEIDPAIDLTLTPEETRFTPEETALSGGESTQSKVKESKGKEIQNVANQNPRPAAIPPDEPESIFPDEETSGPEDGEPPDMQEAKALALLLITEHRKTDPKFLAAKNDEKTAAAWAKDVEKLIRIDKRDPEDIREVIRWAKAPGCFWLPNIASGHTLREKYPTLLAQMQREKTQPRATPRDFVQEAENQRRQMARDVVRQLKQEAAT